MKSIAKQGRRLILHALARLIITVVWLGALIVLLLGAAEAYTAALVGVRRPTFLAHQLAGVVRDDLRKGVR